MGKSISAGIIVKSGDLYLMCHATRHDFIVDRNDERWGFPKGVVDVGEDLKTTAMREFHEETGCDLTTLGFEPTYLGINHTKWKSYVAFLVIDDGRLKNLQFTCNSMIDHDKIPILFGKPEVDAFEWFSLQECRELASHNLKSLFNLRGLE